MRKVTCITHPGFSVDATKKNSALIQSHQFLLHYSNDDPEKIFRME